MSSRPELKIDWATYEAAKYACLHWHYAKTIPANRSNFLGIWENQEFKGVIIFGLGASPSLGKPYGLGIFQVCELTRIALKEHYSPVSRMVKIAILYLRKKNPNLRLIVSFADPFHDHHGGIYQAGNWIFTGTSAPSEIYKLRDGKLVDPRRYNGHGHNKKTSVPLGAILIKTPGKYRYLMPLDDEMRKQIEPLRKPYPKRVTKATPDDQLGGGGAIPTHALQDKRDKQAMASDQGAQRRGSADRHAPIKRPKQAMAGSPPEQRQCDTDPDAPNLKGDHGKSDRPEGGA